MCIECRVDKLLTTPPFYFPGSYSYDRRALVALYHEGFTVNQLERMYPGFEFGVIADVIEVWA